MILEETIGQIKVMLEGRSTPLNIGDTFEDAQYSLVTVFGSGVATFRVDPSSTVEKRGVPFGSVIPTGNRAPQIAPVVQAAPEELVIPPIAARITPPVESSSESTKEA
jgi:hypothetical protein